MPRVKPVADVNGKQYGYEFECPGCKMRHVVGNTWKFYGDHDRPTFVPSIRVTLGPEANSDGLARPGATNRTCHSYVTGGRIQFLHDTWHVLSGKTVDLPELP